MKQINHPRSEKQTNKVIDFEKESSIDDLVKDIKKETKNDKSKITEKVIKFGMKYKEILAIAAIYVLISGIGLNIYWAIKHYIISSIIISSVVLISLIIKLVKKYKK